MDTNGQAGTSGGGGGAKNQTTSSRRNQNSTNGHLHEKIHQMIYGYLIRNGLTSAAESLRLESRHLPQNLQHPFMILNDSMHDHNLEEIIQVFHRDGHFGISQNMVAFGIELRNITKKFIELVPQCVDSNSLHQQLYGQSVYSRQQAQHNYNLRPAPQAYAQMKQKEANLQAEISFLRQQIPTVAVATVAPPPPLQEAPPPPPLLHQQEASPQIMEMEPEEPRSSRRKPTHPQNRNQAVENAFVGYINERAAEMPIDSLLDEPFGLDFTLRPEFLMSYDPMHDDVNDPLLHPLHQEGSQEDQQRFDEVFETVLTETEQRAHLEEGGSSLVIEEEVVVETAQTTQDYGSSHHGGGGGVGGGGAQVQYPPPHSKDVVDRLLSPILRHQTDFQSPSQSASHHSGLNVSSSRLPPPPPLSSRPPPQNDVLPKKEIPSTSDERRVSKRDGEKKERKYDERSERSARNSISPARSRTSDESRRRDRDRRHRDSEKEKDRQETDRESTSSAASTTTTSGMTSESKKETETERRRRKEKEREERLRANTSSSSRSKSRNLNLNPEHAANLLTTIKTAGGMTSSSSSEKNHGSSKRKAEVTMAPLTTYKIPKRAPNSTPSDDQSFGRGELPTSSSTTSRGDRGGVERAERAGSKKPSPTATISEGFDVEDNTRFILPMGHAARLSSILLNCDAMYQEYQNRLKGKESNGKENNSSTTTVTTTTSVVPPSPILPSTSEAPPPVRPHHPKGHQYAPMKGSSMSMEAKEKPTDAHSSASSSSGSSSSGSSISDASDSSEDDDVEAPPPTSSSKSRKHAKTRRSESPEEKNKLKKLINQKHADKLLDRLHGK